MSILVTGSVAIDHIMVFQDRFKNHILPDQIDVLSVAFVAPTLDKRWGGTGANIAFNLRRLDADPVLLATAGSDLGPYANWLDSHGIRRHRIRILEDAFTAQCFIITDLGDNQITAFHPGAMDRAHEARLEDVEETLSIGIVSPNGKQAMQENARSLKARGIPCVVDPGQGLPLFDAAELTEMLEGASIYIVNEYEWALTQERLQLHEDEIAERVGALVVTRGEKGSFVRRGGRDVGLTFEADRSEIAAVKADPVVDPTGCGDAYRAGLLHALDQGWSVEAGAHLGAVMGALKVSRAGPQSIEEDRAEILERFERESGQTPG